jgi:hypothetical protein
LTNLSIERSRIEHQSDIYSTRSESNPRVEHQILFETQPDGHGSSEILFVNDLNIDNANSKILNKYVIYLLNDYAVVNIQDYDLL